MRASFVGRESELDTLSARLGDATTRAAGFVLVQGPGGSGKTATVRAFCARQRQARVFWVTTDEAEQDLPFGIVDELSRQLTDRTPTRIRPKSRPQDPLLEGADLLQQLDAAQSGGPIILVVDDVHLADRPSLTALTFALRRLHHDKVLCVLLTREKEAPVLPAGLLRLIADRGTTVALDGISTSEVVALSAKSGFGDLSVRAAERLREHTGGQPLHLLALFGELTQSQAEAVETPLPVPRSLAFLVTAVVSQLTEPAQRLAAATAVLGYRASLHDVALVAGVRNSVPAVEELQKSALVGITDDGVDGPHLHFVHPLVRSAVHDDLGMVTRCRMHASAASLRTGVQALRHRVAAATAPAPDLVGDLLVHAEAERARGAWRPAADALLAATRLAPAGPSCDRLFMDAVELLLVDGDLVAAQAYAERLANLPRDAHRLQIQARIAWLSGHHSEASDLAMAAWEQAASLREDTRDDLAAMLAQLSILRGDNAGAARWAECALISGLLPEDTAATTRVAGAIGLALTGRSQAGLRLLPDLEQDARNVPPARLSELRGRGMLRLWTDDLDGAQADLGASLPSPRQGSVVGGLEPYRLVALCYLAETDYRRGDWDSAAALAEQAVSLVEDTGQAWLLAFGHAVAVLVPAARGQWSLAEQHLRAAGCAAAELGDQPSRAYHDNAAVHLAACRGDYAGVLLAAQWLVAGGRAGGHEPGFLGWSVHHASALVALGRLDEASAALDGLEDVARARGRRSRLAAIARVRGELYAARRDSTSARNAFEDGLRWGEGASDALEEALAHASYGRFLRRRGERRAAREQLSTARAMFTATGAEPFVERCDRELEACGMAARVDSGHDGHERLTPQEIAVARLVAGGRTNRQVAAELFLSVKTIGYHLGNVYAKLGVQSRTQLVAHFGDLAAPRL